MKKQEKILLWGSNIWYFGAGLLGPLFAVFTQRVGGDVLSISWVWGAYLIAMGISVMVIGKLSDRFKNKDKLVLVGYFLNAVFTFAYLLVDSPTDLLLVQLGLGIAIAFAAPTWDALYDKYSGDGKRDGWVWGLSSGFEKVSTGVGVILGGYIVSIFSFEALFVSMGFIQIVALIIQAQFTRNE